MSDDEQKVDAQTAMQMAIQQVKVKGLTDEQIQMMFDGETEITTREALLVSHIQFLETRNLFACEILEEIASMNGLGANHVAQAALEQLAPVRNISEDDDEQKNE